MLLAIVLLVVCTASASVSGMALRRSVTLPPLESGWRDVTSEISACLPPLPNALATVAVPRGCRIAVLDPQLLEVGPAALVAPNRHASIAVGVRDGRPLLPSDARLVLLRDDHESSDLTLDCTLGCTLEVAIEMADQLLAAPSGPSGAAAIAQAALRTSLDASGVDAAVIAALESIAEPTPASRVYDSYLARAHRPEVLLQDARRAAHHIAHLLREEAANAAEYLRNNDAAIDHAMRRASSPNAVRFLLDNVRSAYNVGSIFRTADTANCAEVITCGFTPHPPNPKLAKTAFGALESVPTRHEESTLHAIRALQAQGVTVYAMETTDRSRSYCDVAFPRPSQGDDGGGGGGGGGVALVLGNEEIGVDTAVMAAVDGLIEIPTFGFKNSLNVASAASIVVYEVLRQWGKLNVDE